VIVTDTLPSHVTFVSANENGLYDQVSHSVTWQISYIMPGETFSLELVVRINSETTLGTIITNRVDVVSITNDPNLANNTALDEVEVIPTDLFIPDVFSPNNDGINDIFIIRGLDRYPNNSLIIINRWGNKVFEAAPYTNDWDGTNQFGITVGGDQLPVGTYYYILDLGESGSNQIRGFIYLTR
jgi:gliding motility-associated-like protein